MLLSFGTGLGGQTIDTWVAERSELRHYSSIGFTPNDGGEALFADWLDNLKDVVLESGSDGVLIHIPGLPPTREGFCALVEAAVYADLNVHLFVG